ncbi:MAG: SRPBCC domain-containing protein [Saprospiraceae bacterium]|nr:SRPBCC domain-containing protein [Saprospiraceae bacterium]
MERKTKNSKIIKATKEKLFSAFTEPKALEIWLVPGEMTGKVHSFDLSIGGGYEMSLFYPDTDKESKGKTQGKEDRYKAKFVELKPFEKIVQTITFDTEDSKMKGEMKMSVYLESVENATKVTITFDNLPIGINLKDNEDGTESSLEKLAQFVDRDFKANLFFK